MYLTMGRKQEKVELSISEMESRNSAFSCKQNLTQADIKENDQVEINIDVTDELAMERNG